MTLEFFGNQCARIVSEGKGIAVVSPNHNSDRFFNDHKSFMGWIVGEETKVFFESFDEAKTWIGGLL